MKKLLVIQTDEAYFLFETLQVLEKYYSSLKNFELTILVDANALKKVNDGTALLIRGITTDSTIVSNDCYDASVNLSLNEASWEFHGKIDSKQKVGIYRQHGETITKDLWSSYLLTLKAKAPFLTFHLQDVYKNILGFKGRKLEKSFHREIKRIAFGFCSPQLFPIKEQEDFLHKLSSAFPNIPIVEIAEVDLVDDVSETAYVGPATLDALKFAEAGGKGIFLSLSFQGFNLLPQNDRHLFISSRNNKLRSGLLLPLVTAELRGESLSDSCYSLYRIDQENVFGAYLKSENASDDSYPFYQFHVVLWNFLLNFFETNLEVTNCTPEQLELLKANKEVLKKFLRLHDYALAAIDKIHQEARSKNADGEKIQGSINNLIEIEKISDQIAASHVFLRPILDFYRIRRGQNEGRTLLEQSQTSFLTYNEEHQALMALDELLSITLKKNEASI